MGSEKLRRLRRKIVIAHTVAAFVLLFEIQSLIFRNEKFNCFGKTMVGAERRVQLSYTICLLNKK